MITIRSKLNIEELDKKIKEQAENKISLNLVYLSTHNIDGSRKDIIKSAGLKNYKTSTTAKKFESLTEDLSDAKSIVADQIRGEWDAIKNYRKAADDLENIDGSFDNIINILNDIADEEETHAGELENVANELDDKTLDRIDDGRNEAENKMSEPAEELDYDEEPVEESLNEEIENDQLTEIEKYIEDLYQLRKDSLEKEGQYGVGNLVFKEIRNKGYLDKLKDLKNEIISKELSLESLNESSNLSDADKMRMFNGWIKAGKPRPYNTNIYRAENITRCSDSKLTNFHKICQNNNYYDANKEIENEMINRGILQGFTNNLGAVKQVPVLDEMDFHPADGRYIHALQEPKEDWFEDDLNLTGSTDETARILLVYLIWAVALQAINNETKQAKNIEALKKELLHNTAWTLQQIKDAISKAISDQAIMQRIFDFTTELKETNESLSAEDIKDSSQSDISNYNKAIADYDKRLLRLGKTEASLVGKNGILSEKLEKATAYMIRNDGEVFKCQSYHPYISNIYDDAENDLSSIINERLDELIWFYNNTLNSEVKKSIQIIVKTLCRYDENIFKSTEELYKLFNISDETYLCRDKKELKAFFNELNNSVNQEFCKVRTSNIKFGGDNNDIYFRISSIGFNWFNIIWEFIEQNRQDISTVTISRDSRVRDFEQKDCYIIGNKKIDHLPVDEFLTLPGNPVLESFCSKLNTVNEANKLLINGKSLEEAYPNLHPKDINGFYNYQLKEQFSWELANSQYLSEVLQPRQRELYRQELSRITFNQALIQDNGLFHIYNIKEDDVDRILNRIRQLDYIEEAHKTAGRYDFSKVIMPGQMAPRYYEISGRIKN